MKHFTTVLTGILCTFLLNYSNAQHSCGQNHLHEQQLEADPDFANRLKANEKKIKAYLETGAQRSVSGTYTLPIVVHVIYTDETADNNISDEQIISAIQRLNEQFSNADGNSEDTNIQFQLATMDDNCQPTTGILRVDGSGVTNYVDHGIDIEYTDSDGIGAKIKDVLELSRWSSDQFINLYIVNEINNNDGGYGIQGFSWVPGNPDPYDGLVLLYNTLGYDYDNCDCYELKSYTELNTTFAHEMGHYLNLYHTFQGDSNGSSCPSTNDNEGDYVADTPAHIRISSTCPSGNNNCYSSSHPYYDIDLVGYNMMGYSSASCRYQFSVGQAERMVAAIETSRPGLLASAGLQTTSVSMVSPSCMPQTSTGISGEYGVGPTLVKIGDMCAGSGTAYEDGGYLERPCFTSTLETGQTYDIEITTQGFYNEDIRVYADWDNSGDMGADELIFSGDNNSFFSGSFTVPADATSNEWLRLRVISDHESKNINSSCFAPQYGQVEDYPISVQGLNPAINASITTLSGFSTLITEASSAQTFTVSGSELTENVTVSTTSEDFEISTDGTAYGSELSFSPNGTTLEETTVYVRLKSNLSAGTKTGLLSVSYPAVNTLEVSLEGEVEGITNDRGNALLLDGDGDYLTTELNIDPSSQNFTLECWLNMDGSETGFQVIFDQTSDDRTHMFLVSAWKNKFTARFAGQWVNMDAEAEFQYDTWHHLALTWDNSIFNFYLDGQLIGTSEISNPQSNAEVLHLGTYDESNAFFKGQIDELRIWNSARTQLEIVQNMHLTAEVKNTADVTYFQFNENNGPAVNDYSQSISATLVGESSLTTSSSNVGHGGEAASVSGIVEAGELVFAACDFEMDLTAVSDTSEFTIVYQAYPPNTTTGISAGDIYEEQTWTLHQTSGGLFSADLTFLFPEGYFTDLTVEAYQLYHRSANSDGEWSLLVDGASSVTQSNVVFAGVGETGQFLVVKE